ncbi:MAG: hypothetical protein KGM16_17060 [Bacteroidota bacterium]|nr:hypothetical protein [Bacteroidota bacterium]
MEFRETIQQYAGQPLSRQVLLDALQDYKRPWDKIHELVKQGLLTRLKRGIYIPGPRLNMATPEPFLLANHLAGPSYVSLQAALSWHGLIPERVYEISSVTTQKSKVYQTPEGKFTYTHLPLPYYAYGIRQVELAKDQSALVASAEKALCDLVATTPGILLRSVLQATELLLEDLRMDENMLHNLDVSKITSWIPEAPKMESLAILVKTLKSL